MQSINFYGSISFLGRAIGIFGHNLELLKSSGFYVMQKLLDRLFLVGILLAIFAKGSPKRLQFFNYRHGLALHWHKHGLLLLIFAGREFSVYIVFILNEKSTLHII